MTRPRPRGVSKSSSGRVQPAWVPYFLRALERTGRVREAALDAGVDYSTAYARRRAHAEFKAAWVGALSAHAARAEEEKAEALAAVRLAPPPPAAAPLPTGFAGREELACAGGQLKRVNQARWSMAAEVRFFATLADTANVVMAAEAAGFSTTAVYQRRLRRPEFREAWAAAVETGRARLELALIEMANRAIERGVPEVPDEAPRVSISEALQILKLGAEPRVPTDAVGRRRLNAGARGNLYAANNAEIAEALAKRLKEFAKRAARPKEAGKSEDGESGEEDITA
jgi:hypothetical protein